jgi:adenylyltransferase/sulfurtransferase
MTDQSTGAATAIPGDIDVHTLHLELNQTSAPILIDVREEFERGVAFIESSRHLPEAEVPARIGAEVPDRQTPIVVYCALDQRARAVAERLASIGYANVRVLAGGLTQWERSGLPVTLPRAGSRREWSARYARQLRLPEVGPEGQKKLLAARVLIIGVGGLGSPAAIYLAAAGVGTLGLVDFDHVDESNLHRQILFGEPDVGMPKVYGAQARLQALNPHTKIVPYPERFSHDNAERIGRDYDLILDGTDNFAARYLVNDVCLMLGIPNVHASIHRFEGQMSVFCRPGGPCYRCLHPEPPPAGLVPSCAEVGVLGILPGVLGSLQATETIKLILGLGSPLSGRLLRFDALALSFETFQVPRREDCGWCSGDFPGLADYDALCGPA